MSNTPNINQVRQVLMNELGLTRDSIREVIEKIVTETVDKHMASLESSGRLNIIVENAFRRKYKNPNSLDSFATLVTNAAQESARKFVRDNVHISLNESK